MFRKLAAEFLVLSGLFLVAVVVLYWPQAPGIRHWFCRRGAGVRSDRSEMAFAVGHISGGHFNPAVTIVYGLADVFRQKKSLAT